MPVTPNFAIPYPDGTTSLTPLQDRFADIANSVDSAMLAGLAGAPRQVNSDSERTTVFPAAVQGNLANRPDKGYIEVYLAAYNASTNPGGAATAGWYPLPGTLLGSVYSFPAYVVTASLATVPSLSMTAYAPGTPVLIRANMQVQNSGSGAARIGTFQLFEDGIAVTTARTWMITYIGTGGSVQVVVAVERTPTAGIHTYTVQASASLANAITVMESEITAIATARKV